ncbi:hypothetical protein [Chryseobacterium sp. FH1]|uniref:hypothetical protein n=1 Tax=Chryseobacterium sp. FH1 TaxID=1233951 RepID=UPI0004E38C45|nr:hypothetical protein [Chryseobacterium sp. FH1]KFC19363.1 hypothetical protein IO90_08650 [Chryseobacterium sp. FH1]
MVIAIISADKAHELKGKVFENEILYNPNQLEDGRWFISLPEAQYLNASDIVELFDFVRVDDESEI